jgi:hypothetical protein
MTKPKIYLVVEPDINNPMSDNSQIDIFAENTTHLKLNCAYSEQFDGDWFKCKLRPEKVTSLYCMNCPEARPIDPSVPVDSLGSVNNGVPVSRFLTLSATERRMRAESSVNVIDSGGRI